MADSPFQTEHQNPSEVPPHGPTEGSDDRRAWYADLARQYAERQAALPECFRGLPVTPGTTPF